MIILMLLCAYVLKFKEPAWWKKLSLASVSLLDMEVQKECVVMWAQGTIAILRLLMVL